MGSSIYPWKPGNDESVVEPLSDVNANAVALYRNIKRLKLDVNQHVPIHGNPGSNADFERIVGPVAARAPQQGGGG